jgi:hypothetical protein
MPPCTQMGAVKKLSGHVASAPPAVLSRCDSAKAVLPVSLGAEHQMELVSRRAATLPAPATAATLALSASPRALILTAVLSLAV